MTVKNFFNESFGTTYTEDFNGTYHIFNNSGRISSGRLYTPLVSGSGVTETSSRGLIVQGDFDIQVDYDFTSGDAENAYAASLSARKLDNSGLATAWRGHSGGLWVFQSTSGYDLGAAAYPTGKLRITRVGTIVAGYWWTGSAWNIIGTDGGTETIDSGYDGDCYISLGTSSWLGAPDANVYWDNFIVNSSSGLYADYKFIDKFEGTGPEAPTENWWTEPTYGWRVENDALYFQDPTPATYNQVTSRFKFDGDFDVQVDWEVVLPAPPSSNSYVRFSAYIDGTSANRLILSRQRSSTTNLLTMGGKVGDVWQTGQDITTTATTGKYRITRVGNIARGYYDIGAGWVQFTPEYDYSALSNPRTTIVFPALTADGLSTIRLRNFVVNSCNRMVWPYGVLKRYTDVTPSTLPWTDEFNTINTDYWTELGIDVPANKYIEQLGGIIRFHGNTPVAGQPYLKSDFLLQGDFDIEMNSVGGTYLDTINRRFAFQVYDSVTSTNCLVRHGIDGVVGRRFNFQSSTVNVSQAIADVSDFVKFRLVRSGNTITGYGTEFGGTEYSYVFPDTFANDCWCRGIFRVDQSPICYIDVDNFKINSADGITGVTLGQWTPTYMNNWEEAPIVSTFNFTEPTTAMDAAYWTNFNIVNDQLRIGLQPSSGAVRLKYLLTGDYSVSCKYDWTSYDGLVATWVHTMEIRNVDDWMNRDNTVVRINDPADALSVYRANFENGSNTDAGTHWLPPDTFWLRKRRVGSLYYQEYSTNGTVWNNLDGSPVAYTYLDNTVELHLSWSGSTPTEVTALLSDFNVTADTVALNGEVGAWGDSIFKRPILNTGTTFNETFSTPSLNSFYAPTVSDGGTEPEVVDGEVLFYLNSTSDTRNITEMWYKPELNGSFSAKVDYRREAISGRTGTWIENMGLRLNLYNSGGGIVGRITMNSRRENIVTTGDFKFTAYNGDYSSQRANVDINASPTNSIDDNTLRFEFTKGASPATSPCKFFIQDNGIEVQAGGTFYMLDEVAYARVGLFSDAQNAVAEAYFDNLQGSADSITWNNIGTFQYVGNME